MIIELNGVSSGELHSLHEALVSPDNKTPAGLQARGSGCINYVAVIHKVEIDEGRGGAAPHYKVVLEVAEQYIDSHNDKVGPVSLRVLARVFQAIGRFPGSAQTAEDVS